LIIAPPLLPVLPPANKEKKIPIFSGQKQKFSF